MTTMIQGTVEVVRKVKSATNIKLDDGNWYGCGFEGVPCEEGDFVSFPAVQRGRFWNADVSKMEVTKGGGQPTAPAQPKPRQSSSGGASSRDDYWQNKERKDDERQRSIQYQWSINAATQVVRVALEHDSAPLPQKKQDRYEAIVSLVRETAGTLRDMHDEDVLGAEQSHNSGNTESVRGGDGFED